MHSLLQPLDAGNSGSQLFTTAGVAQQNSNDSVVVRVHDGIHGNRGTRRPRSQAQLERQQDLELRTRFRRLEFTSGVDMFLETNWCDINGNPDGPKPEAWHQQMAAQRGRDREKNRGAQFYEALDNRLANHETVHMPMSRDQRVATFGGLMSVHPAPGARPLSRQRDVGGTIHRVVEANRRFVRERSRSRDDPWQGSTGWA